MTMILLFLIYSFITLLFNIAEKSLCLFQKKLKKFQNEFDLTCVFQHLIKIASVHNNKPKYQCKICGQQVVVNPTKTTVLQETKRLINRLLLERISLREIARVTQVSWSWLQNYVNQKLAQTGVTAI